MAELTFRSGVAEASPRRWGATRVLFFGENVGERRRRVQDHRRAFDAFGPDRVRTHRSPNGHDRGDRAALTGLRPVGELMFSDFLAVAWDRVLNEIADPRHDRRAGRICPWWPRRNGGDGAGWAGQHSRTLENRAMAVPGLKVVAPSTARRRDGLMATAIRDDNPVVFFDHKKLYATKEDVPDGEIVDALGDRSRAGRRVGRDHRSPGPPWSRWPSTLPPASPSPASPPRSSTCAAWSPSTPPPSWSRYGGRDGYSPSRRTPASAVGGRRWRPSYRGGVHLGPGRAHRPGDHSSHPAALVGRAGRPWPYRRWSGWWRRCCPRRRGTRRGSGPAQPAGNGVDDRPEEDVMQEYRITVIPGDGVGTEVSTEAVIGKALRRYPAISTKASTPACSGSASPKNAVSASGY